MNQLYVMNKLDKTEQAATDNKPSQTSACVGELKTSSRNCLRGYDLVSKQLL